MSKPNKRRPRTKSQLREKANGEYRAGRGYIPTEKDDLVTKKQRSWKKFRKTKHKQGE